MKQMEPPLWRRRLVSVIALCAACVVLPTATGAASAGSIAPAVGPLLPSQDAFYRYSATTALAKARRGAVLRSRRVGVALFSLPLPFTAEQVLYRTTDELGQPAADAATIIRPLISLGTKIVSYQMAYDTLGPKCDSSYLLRGGNPSYTSGTAGDPEVPFVAAYVAAGYTVVVPDYEGTRHEWISGQRSGYSTLDAIRASESYLHVPQLSTPVALVGYSGGSVATEWAAELAPRYAPNLHLVGAAAGGVPVDLAHNLAYINGSKDWSGVIPGVLVGASRGFHIDLNPYLSAYGHKLAMQVQNDCINDFLGAYPGLTVKKLFKPKYQNFTRIPALAEMFNKLLMGSTPGHPTIPLLFGVGNADGTGDDVMIAKDVEGLAHEYCTQGVPVQFAAYQGLSHGAAAVPFELSALAFIESRMLGGAPSNGCASVGKGNALTPLPVSVG